MYVCMYTKLNKNKKCKIKNILVLMHFYFTIQGRFSARRGIAFQNLFNNLNSQRIFLYKKYKYFINTEITVIVWVRSKKFSSWDWQKVLPVTVLTLNQFHFDCWANFGVSSYRKVYVKMACLPNNSVMNK